MGGMINNLVDKSFLSSRPVRDGQTEAKSYKNSNRNPGQRILPRKTSQGVRSFVKRNWCYGLMAALIMGCGALCFNRYQVLVFFRHPSLAMTLLKYLGQSIY